MKLAKSILLSTILMASPFYAHAITPTETGSLATIAAIDKSEILVSEVALNKHVDSDVADFAKMMIDQHSDNLTQVLELANQLHAIPFKGGDAAKMMAQNDKDLVALGGLKGKDFETTYANAMVTGHEGALKLIDSKLLPAANDAAVKKFLTDTRAVVVVHLEHAKAMQKKLQS